MFTVQLLISNPFLDLVTNCRGKRLAQADQHVCIDESEQSKQASRGVRPNAATRRCCSFLNSPSSSFQSMANATINQNDDRSKSSRRVAKMHRVQEAVAPSSSLKSRMIRFIFQRSKRAHEQQSKSWPGRVERSSVPVPASVSTDRIETHDGLGLSAPSAGPTSVSLHTQVKRVARKGSADGDPGRAPWRQRQTHCANCERLFFTSLSSLRGAAGRFCSLDCKTNLEYMHRLQNAVVEYTQTWESSASSSELGHKEEVQETTSKEVGGLDRQVVCRRPSSRCCSVIGHRSVTGQDGLHSSR